MKRYNCKYELKLKILTNAGQIELVKIIIINRFFSIFSFYWLIQYLSTFVGSCVFSEHLKLNTKNITYHVLDRVSEFVIIRPGNIL